MEVRKSENLDFQISENPDFRKSDFRKSGKPENPDFRIFRFSGFSENRKIQKSGKKASDVEFAYVEFPLKSMVFHSVDIRMLFFVLQTSECPALTTSGTRNLEISHTVWPDIIVPPNIIVPGIRISGISRKSGYPDTRKSGYPDTRKSGNPDIRIPEIRNSGNPDFRRFGSPEI